MRRSANIAERRWSRGYTLVEVLITVVLFTLLVLGITQLYVVYGRVISLQTSSIGIALNGSSIIDAVRAAALPADHVVAAHTFSGVGYTTSADTALFELPAIDSSGAVIPNAYDYVGIYASGTNVYRVIDAAVGSVRIAGTKRLTDALGALSFTYDNADLTLVTNVVVDATTTAVVHGQTTQVHLRTRVYLRNL